MKLFICEVCGNVLYFNNHQCVVCKHKVGFCPDTLRLVGLTPTYNGGYTEVNDESKRYKFCENINHGVCNWLIRAEDPNTLCKGCQLNRLIPDLSKEENVRKWAEVESAKDRLLFSLLRLKLPMSHVVNGSEQSLQFHFLSNNSSYYPVITGHNQGVITINIDEADELHRNETKVQLGETYRTVLGHFRHESGHFYWDVLIRDTEFLNEFRYLFGDELTDYNQALQEHYKYGAPADWKSQYISQYATSHPWEDWAETWAHYMHVLDAIETATAFGMGVHPPITNNQAFHSEMNIDPYETDDFRVIMGKWLPFTIAANSINRSMGHPDFYTFYISPIVVEKMTFIHRVCMTNRALVSANNS